MKYLKRFNEGSGNYGDEYQISWAGSLLAFNNPEIPINGVSYNPTLTTETLTATKCKCKQIANGLNPNKDYISYYIL